MPKHKPNKKVERLNIKPNWIDEMDSKWIKANYDVRKAILDRITPIYEKDLALFKEAEAKYIKYFGKKREEVTK